MMTSWTGMSRNYLIDRTVQITCTALLFLFFLAQVNSSSANAASIYTVAKVKLDVSADNAVMAKKKALEEGPLIAFKQMFRKITTFRAYNHLNRLTLDEAEKVLNGFTVRSERNSPTRYLAMIDYSFSRDRLETMLSEKGIPFYTGRSRSQLIMPVAMTVSGDNDSKLAGIWKKVWHGLDLKNGLTDSRLLLPNKEDLALWQRIELGDKSAFGELRERHKGRKLIIVALGQEPDGARLRLQMLGEDRVGRFNHGQLLPISQNDLNQASQQASQIAYGIVEGRWREPQIEGEVVPVRSEGANAAETVSLGTRLVDETVFVRVAFRGLRDWQQIRKRLKKVPGVRKMKINSLSPRGADVRMTYPGGVRRLQSQLSSYGFRIDQEGSELVLSSIK